MLFELLKDYWVHFHHAHRLYFWWLKHYMPKVKRLIQKKWLKRLPKREIVLKTIEENDEDFNPLAFKENRESYFEKLLAWETKNEQYHAFPISFRQIRHKKVYGTVKPLRWLFFYNFKFFWTIFNWGRYFVF